MHGRVEGEGEGGGDGEWGGKSKREVAAEKGAPVRELGGGGGGERAAWWRQWAKKPPSPHKPHTLSS